MNGHVLDISSPHHSHFSSESTRQINSFFVTKHDIVHPTIPLVSDRQDDHQITFLFNHPRRGHPTKCLPPFAQSASDSRTTTPTAAVVVVVAFLFVRRAKWNVVVHHRPFLLAHESQRIVKSKHVLLRHGRQAKRRVHHPESQLRRGIHDVLSRRVLVRIIVGGTAVFRIPTTRTATATATRPFASGIVHHAIRRLDNHQSSPFLFLLGRDVRLTHHQIHLTR
mmetsp:Transcript_33551/g.70537  ORF Transcript_33551/g.70537 Transcript_33551/m.70537 type:complete len:223 (-) Transcript_33551:1551-2219(-)